MRLEVEGLSADAGEKQKPVPPGMYQMIVANVEDKVTKGGDNPGRPMLAIKAQILGGDHDGRPLFGNFVVPNKAIDDDKAYTFMRSQLKRFCIACGVNVEADGFDTQDLMGKKFTGVTKIKNDRAELDDYLPAQG